MKRRFLAVITTLVLTGAIGASQAAAATEFGSNCAATSGESGLTVLGVSQSPAEPLSVAAPANGVITRWKSTIGVPIPPGILQVTLQVYRPAGPNLFTLVGQSASMPVNSGVNSFSTRVPVQTGDRLGFFGTAGAETVGLFCETGQPADVMGYTEAPPSLGGTALFETVPGFRVPLSAVIEPDADNDGFGDETQDGCPQSAAIQTACPPVALSTSTQVKKGSVTVIVTSSTAAPVTVKGVAKLGKGKKAKLNGGTQNMVPGTLSKFRLFFTKALKNKLKELPPKRSVRLNVTVTGTSVSGAVTTKTLKLRLKGQAKG
jgi:hypothetical protein